MKMIVKKQFKLFCLCFFALFGQKAKAMNFNLQLYCDSLKKVSKTATAFLTDFPYEKYAESINYYDIEALEKDRQLLDKSFKCGQDVLYKTLEWHFLKDTLSIDTPIQVASRIEIGIFYAHFKNHAGSNMPIYSAIGDGILSQIAKSIERDIASHKIDKEDAPIKYLMARLEAAKYFVAYRPSDAHKFWLHVKQGDWAYLWDRICIKATEQRGTIVFSFILLGFCIFLFQNRAKWQFKLQFMPLKKEE